MSERDDTKSNKTATYLRLCILLTYFLLALDTVELGKSILLPLKYSGFLLLLLSSVNLFFWDHSCFDSLSLLDHPLTKLAHHNLHHCQMLQIIMRLEKRVSSVEFYKDTAYTEHVTGIGPRETEDDFGGTIVSGGDDRGMVFRLERGGTEIDQTDFSVLPGRLAIRTLFGMENIP